MDIINFLGSVNKLSVLAFLVTFAVLVYEVHLLKKEKELRTKPKIPKFEESIKSTITQGSVLVVEKQKKIVKPNNLVIIALIVLLFFFGIATVFGFTSYREKANQLKISPTPIIDFITSKGIKIFDENFNTIIDTQLGLIKQGKEIIIGIETIENLDIDRARIRVNKNNWQTEDITVNFSPEHQVFYIKYPVASGESKLKIEAQLHSASEGWLGD